MAKSQHWNKIFRIRSLDLADFLLKKKKKWNHLTKMKPFNIYGSLHKTAHDSLLFIYPHISKANYLYC